MTLINIIDDSLEAHKLRQENFINQNILIHPAIIAQEDYSTDFHEHHRLAHFFENGFPEDFFENPDYEACANYIGQFFNICTLPVDTDALEEHGKQTLENLYLFNELTKNPLYKDDRDAGIMDIAFEHFAKMVQTPQCTRGGAARVYIMFLSLCMAYDVIPPLCDMHPDWYAMTAKDDAELKEVRKFLFPTQQEKEIQKKEIQKKEIQKKEIQKKEIQKKEIQEKEIKQIQEILRQYDLLRLHPITPL